MTGQLATGGGRRDFDDLAIHLSGHSSMVALVALVAGSPSGDCSPNK
jgi:hypothetical protein